MHSQMFRKRVRAVLSLTMPLCVVVAFFVWQNHESYREYLLDRNLCSAVKVDDLPRVRDLLHQGANPNSREVPSPQPAGLVARFRRMLFGPPPDEPSWTVLHRAAYMGFDESAGLLLSSGAKVNALCKGSTPLVAAAGYGRSRMVSRLLAAGADPNAQYPGGGVTIMWAAAGSCDVAAVRDMIKHGAKLHPPFGLFIGAASNKDPAVMALLLDQGFSADSNKKQTGWPLLYYAVAAGNTPIVRLLLLRGAIIDERDRNGQTPRQVAESIRARYTHTDMKERAAYDDIIQLLKSYGAK